MAPSSADARADRAAPRPDAGCPGRQGRERYAARAAAAASAAIASWPSSSAHGGAVAAGAGAAAVIRGEAGIGKTRLATELRVRASAAGAQTAACAALDLGGAAPLSLWAELIRELLPSLPAPPADAAWPDDLAALAAELPGALRSRAPRRARRVAPDLQRTRLFEAVVALLGWAARAARRCCSCSRTSTAPTFPASSWPATPLDGSSGLPVMMLITRRELPHSAAADTLEHALRARGMLRCELDLGPLAPSPGRRAGPPGSAAHRRRTCGAWWSAPRATRCSPSRPRGRSDAGRTRSRPACADRCARRSRRCPARCASSSRSPPSRRRPLRAVRARPARASRTRRGRRRSAADAACCSAADGAVGFRHALLRDAVYEEIAEPRRRGAAPALGARAARRRAGRGDPAAGRGRPPPPARRRRRATRSRSSSRAAADARALAALEQAVGYLEEALAIAPDRADLWLELGELEAWRVRRDQAEAAFERATEPARRTPSRWSARGRGCAARAPTTARSASRARCSTAREPRSSCSSAASSRPAQERSEALAALRVGRGGRRQRRGSRAAAGASSAPTRPRETTAAHLRRRPCARARADAPRPVRRVLRAVDRRRRGDREGRPTRPRLRLLGERRQRGGRGRRARAGARVPRSRHRRDRRAGTAEPRDPPAGREVVRAQQRRPARAGARRGRRPSRRSPSSSAQPELLAMASHDRGLVALEQGEHALAASAARRVARRGRADQPAADAPGARRGARPRAESPSEPPSRSARPCSNRSDPATSPKRSCRGSHASRD